MLGVAVGNAGMATYGIRNTEQQIWNTEHRTDNLER